MSVYRHHRKAFQGLRHLRCALLPPVLRCRATSFEAPSRSIPARRARRGGLLHCHFPVGQQAPGSANALEPHQVHRGDAIDIRAGRSNLTPGLQSVTQRRRSAVPNAPRKPHRAARRGGVWPVSCGSLEALKWVGLLLMTGDHVNKYLLAEASQTLYALGRMVMPLFGFVLMANLSRPGALESGMHLRVMKRLAVFALLATPAFVHLVGWWPLNILATLLLATLIVWLLERDSWIARCSALIAFIVGGAVVEFWWPALLYCIGSWAFIRRPSGLRMLWWASATGSLAAVNGNFAAMAALLLIWGARQVEIPCARGRWVFYAFYPIHLSLIALILIAVKN
ncbi:MULTISPECIES: TraX family protein [Variovorax]|uniref:TraX family protein n=1 Tax=Variovorax TaxID=34072 RepID=UPI00286CCD64|nr:TraX family protein [Variovorax sp. 3319]